MYEKTEIAIFFRVLESWGDVSKFLVGGRPPAPQGASKFQPFPIFFVAVTRGKSDFSTDSESRLEVVHAQKSGYALELRMRHSDRL